MLPFYSFTVEDIFYFACNYSMYLLKLLGVNISTSVSVILRNMNVRRPENSFTELSVEGNYELLISTFSSNDSNCCIRLKNAKLPFLQLYSKY